jgi:hypothetical protein
MSLSLILSPWISDSRYGSRNKVQYPVFTKCPSACLVDPDIQASSFYSFAMMDSDDLESGVPVISRTKRQFANVVVTLLVNL